MDEFLKMDVFFFVTTVAVVVFSIALLVALYHLIRILRNVDEISEEVKGESTLIREDIHELRQNIKTEGAKIKHFTDFASNVVTRHKTRKPRATKKAP